MRGELDDALARLRRWNEVRARLAGEPVGGLPEPADPPAPLVPEPAPAPPPIPVSGALPATPTSPAGPSYPMEQDVRPTSPPGPSYPPAGQVAPPAHLANTEVPHQPGPGSPAHTAPDQGLLPRSVEDVLNALSEVIRRYSSVAVSVAVDDAGSVWTAQMARGEDGQPFVTRLESRGPSANGGGGHGNGGGQMNGGGQANGGAPPSQWPPNTARPAEATISSAEISRPVSISRSGEAPERTASRLAELVRRDPSLLDPPG